MGPGSRFGDLLATCMRREDRPERSPSAICPGTRGAELRNASRPMHPFQTARRMALMMSRTEQLENCAAASAGLAGGLRCAQGGVGGLASPAIRPAAAAERADPGVEGEVRPQQAHTAGD